MITLEIAGSPKPQARPRLTKYGGVYSPKTNWYKKIKTETFKYYLENGRKPVVDYPCTVSIKYYMPRPKSHYRTGRYSHLLKDSAPIQPVSKPDIDNLNKAVLDAIQDSKVLSDDSLVLEIYASKQYAEYDCFTGAIIWIGEKK
jgi:Holliday junction resolvase RusA-like endonuclease